MSVVPRNTWFDFKGKSTPYAMFLEALAGAGEAIPGIFVSWIARQSTCEYMLWNYILEFHETREIVQENTIYSKRGDELHNELAFGSIESPLEEFKDGTASLQWRNETTLREYQANRLASIHDGKITEYSLVGEICGLKIRGTLDAFDLATGNIIEYKTRAKPTIAYLHEKKNKLQALCYHYLIKTYNTALNHPGFPVSALSDHVRVIYLYQETGAMIGEQVIHVPYESYRFQRTMESFKEFWTGKRKPSFSLQYCFLCKYKERCYFHKRFYKPPRRGHSTRDAP